ncbi:MULTISPECIES: hypothetical protein [Moorena]|uniref:hypothetical protein n=1 Tax=Moorena TaxID=1155738 RepID=UPI0002DF87E1|nr:MULTISPECIES: hypothetical protein [Moorena]NEP32462.1 hypothetical protein [Moorena sp. SIO3B2]NEQ12697.1 hypothetical protein [Moorena sp. SIO3E2]NER89231.1 hypothetical protein [Moorena sp. SIO3A2]NES43124.1 hypothetical protein [Moorena sp. SIO2C4]
MRYAHATGTAVSGQRSAVSLFYSKAPIALRCSLIAECLPFNQTTFNQTTFNFQPLTFNL